MRRPPPQTAPFLAQTRLELLELHIVQGLITLVRQRDVIEELEATGQPTEEAERLLRLFEDVQERRLIRRDQLLGRARLEASKRPSGDLA